MLRRRRIRCRDYWCRAIDGETAQRYDGSSARLHDDARATGGRVDDGLHPLRDDADWLGDRERTKIAGGQNVDRAIVAGLAMRIGKSPAWRRDLACAGVGAGSRDPSFNGRPRSCRACQ